MLSALSFELLMTVGLGVSEGYCENSSVLLCVCFRGGIEAGRHAE